jgi:site-specific DNA-methyltransferase (adenine-specific)
VKPYYADESVTLYLGDCRDIAEWLAAEVLVTDPPYGRGWKQGAGSGNLRSKTAGRYAHEGIAGDEDTSLRDEALAMWGSRLAIVFGDPLVDRPAGTRQALGYRKPPGGGNKGTFGGFLRDLELIYLVGPWPAGLNGRSSILASGARNVASTYGLAGRYGHPHAKPVDVMETLIAACPPGVIADPFAGSGSTLVAARNLGRRAIGVELEERYCERAAERLCQDVLIVGELPSAG